MNRWVLLEHKILGSKLIDIHYDFLVEDQLDCFTWKFHQIPSINEGFVEIEKQPNHRLVWLSRAEYQLIYYQKFYVRVTPIDSLSSATLNYFISIINPKNELAD